VQLSEMHKQNIGGYAQAFREALETPQYQEYLTERRNRTELYRQLLAKEALHNLTEIELGQVIGGLWASEIWSNKSYLVNKIIEDNGIPALQDAFDDLLWADRPLDKRYDSFTKKVKGLGPASVTEILAFVHPKYCGIWNDKARKALVILGLQDILPHIDRYQITGMQYLEFNQLLKLISDQLAGDGLPGLDLVGVDFFLYFVWESQTRPPIVERPEDYDFDHDEIVDKLVAIGQWMGFEAEKERTIAKGARLDVVWRARIANLGVVNYVFEVHRRGSIDSLILNLQRAKRNPSVQRLVVVANTKDLRKVEEEIATLSPEFVGSVAFMEAADTERAAGLVEGLSTIISDLELVRSEF